MLTRNTHEHFRGLALGLLAEAGTALSLEEAERIEVADFGLGEPERSGLQLLTYVNNERYCAKELMLLPYQTCPEHLHPPVGTDPGKMETFRCRWGLIWLYVDGPPTPSPLAKVPEGSEEYYSVFHEIELHPGDQYTIAPGVRHWFQAGAEGAVVSEFSSTSRDESDVFTDPRIVRLPEIEEA